VHVHNQWENIKIYIICSKMKMWEKEIFKRVKLKWYPSRDSCTCLSSVAFWSLILQALIVLVGFTSSQAVNLKWSLVKSQKRKNKQYKPYNYHLVSHLLVACKHLHSSWRNDLKFFFVFLVIFLFWDCSK